MKVLKICLLLIFLTPVKADFDAATEAYHNQQFAEAFKTYDQLARIGNKRAQFNLAVMYLNGEHVKQDLKMAYAWGKLSGSNDNPAYAELTHAIINDMDEPGLLAAEQQYIKLNELYGEAKIYSKLSPIAYQTNTGKQKSKQNFKIKPLVRKGPRYPNEALNKRIQGWVTVGFEVHPDGTARNPYVMDAYPENTFENATFNAIQKFKFEITFDEGVEPFVIYARQTIEYSLEQSTNPTKLRAYYKERLDQLRSIAEQGSGKAQYLYALGASSNIMNKDNKMPVEEVNQWWLKAAQNGHKEAQYQLGKNILRGIGCQVEKQKGIDWIVYAAEQGHAKSSRKAYHLLTKNKHLNNTNYSPEHWLRLAADNGDADSQLDYAEFLINQENVTAKDLIQARHYLEMQAHLRAKNVKWYQLSAAIYRKQGNNKKANSHSKKAAKLAKKLGWQI